MPPLCGLLPVALGMGAALVASAVLTLEPSPEADAGPGAELLLVDWGVLTACEADALDVLGTTVCASGSELHANAVSKAKPAIMRTAFMRKRGRCMWPYCHIS